MAGDWIKMETALHDKPEVIAIAARLKADVDLVVGKLHRLWSWADHHTADGTTNLVDLDWVDCYLGLPGIANILNGVGWLSYEEGVLSIPNFERHMGQSAKKRLVQNERKSRSRFGHKNVTEKCDQSVTHVTKKRDQRREEKRREDKELSFSENRESENTSDNLPTVEEVIATGKQSLSNQVPESFCRWRHEKWEIDNWWLNSNGQLKNWARALQSDWTKYRSKWDTEKGDWKNEDSSKGNSKSTSRNTGTTNEGAAAQYAGM